MLDEIIDAINNRNVITFDYDGCQRIVEPHTVGVSTTGKDSLSTFQIGGQSNTIAIPDWGRFSLNKIQNLNVLGDLFQGVRPRNKKGDSRMTHIYAEL